MATAAERQAVAFLVLVALVGAGVRAVGVERFDREALAAAGTGERDLGAAALAQQLAAVDSARAAPRGGRRRKGSGRKSTEAGRTASSALPDQPTLENARGRRVTIVDVNEASAGELERLPRIGPALAQRIVAWRDQHGPFAGLDDLRHVRGIGPATLRLLAPVVTFSGRPSPIHSEGPPFLPAVPETPIDGYRTSWPQHPHPH